MLYFFLKSYIKKEIPESIKYNIYLPGHVFTYRYSYIYTSCLHTKNRGTIMLLKIHLHTKRGYIMIHSHHTKVYSSLWDMPTFPTITLSSYFIPNIIHIMEMKQNIKFLCIIHSGIYTYVDVYVMHLNRHVA